MAVSQRYEFDMQQFPLVLVNAPEALNEDEVRAMFARFDDLYRARQRYALVMDTTAAREMPNAKQRKLLADLSRATAEEARRWCVGTAMVVDSAAVRGVMTAVAWVVPSPTPTVHVATLEEGIAWCCARLVAGGIELPKGLARYRVRVA